MRKNNIELLKQFIIDEIENLKRLLNNSNSDIKINEFKNLKITQRFYKLILYDIDNIITNSNQEEQWKLIKEFILKDIKNNKKYYCFILSEAKCLDNLLETLSIKIQTIESGEFKHE